MFAGAVSIYIYDILYPYLVIYCLVNIPSYYSQFIPIRYSVWDIVILYLFHIVIPNLSAILAGRDELHQEIVLLYGDINYPNTIPLCLFRNYPESISRMG